MKRRKDCVCPCHIHGGMHIVACCRPDDEDMCGPDGHVIPHKGCILR